MASNRKTFYVKDLIEIVNRRLITPDSTLHLVDYAQPERPGLTPHQAFRLGAASVLEQVLHATDNYAGFSYLQSEVTDTGELKPVYDGTKRRYQINGWL